MFPASHYFVREWDHIIRRMSLQWSRWRHLCPLSSARMIRGEGHMGRLALTTINSSDTLRDDAVTRKNGVCPTGVFKKNVLCYTHFTVLYLSPKTQHITIKLQSWHRSKLTFSPAFCTPVTIYSTVHIYRPKIFS